MTKLKDGELLIGYRFSADAGAEIPTRIGAGATVVVEAIACAGPIFYRTLEVGGHATCRGCGSQSMVGRSDAVRRWAHRHRCGSGQRYDEQSA